MEPTFSDSGTRKLKAATSVTTAHLFADRPHASSLGENENGGGSRYGGTVTGSSYESVYVMIESTFATASPCRRRPLRCRPAHSRRRE